MIANPWQAGLNFLPKNTGEMMGEQKNDNGWTLTDEFGSNC